MAKIIGFDNKKYYDIDESSTSTTISGKTFYAIPKKIKIAKSGRIYDRNSGEIDLTVGDIGKEYYVYGYVNAYGVYHDRYICDESNSNYAAGSLFIPRSMSQPLWGG